MKHKLAGILGFVMLAAAGTVQSAQEKIVGDVVKADASSVEVRSARGGSSTFVCPIARGSRAARRPT